LGDTTSAIDGFSIASAATSQRSAAYNALASIFLSKNDFRKALQYADKSLLYNHLGSDAIQTKILCFRKLGMLKEAGNELTNLELKDPLNHFIRIERYLTDPSVENKTQVQSHITNELPHETYLEYAIWYFRNGQLSDALKVLELAPENHPVVLLWKGYLNHLDGKEDKAVTILTKALLIKPDFVFPFRMETLKPLEWAQSLSDNWKIKYYTGLVYLNAGNEKKGFDLWNSCGDRPDFFPFYIARSKLAILGSQQAQSDVEKALALGGNDWRAGLYASQFFIAKGNLIKSEELARDYYSKNPQNYILGLHYAKVLEMNQKYSVCVSLLQKISVLPNEGATDGRTVWRNANIGNALDLMKNQKYRKAIESAAMARQWPENLGVGKPYQVDERLEDFVALQCYKKLNDQRSAGELQNKIAGNPVLQNLSFDENDFLTAWLLKESGNTSEGDRIMTELLVKNPLSQSVQWCNAVYSGDLGKAVIIQKKMVDSERFAFFLNLMFSDPRILESHASTPNPK